MRRLLPTPARTEVAEVYADLVLPTPAVGRASVHLGMVMSADGAATIGGRTGRLGGAADAAAYRALRGAADAVLVGAGTVRAENYGPAAGSPGRRQRRREKGLAPAPRLVVVSGSLALDPQARLFGDPRHRPLVITTHAAARQDGGRFRGAADLLPVGDERVDLAQALVALEELGLRRVLCEGGPTLNASLTGLELVDGLFLTLVPVLVAGAAPRIVVGEDVGERARQLRLEEVWEHDGELLLRYGR